MVAIDVRRLARVIQLLVQPFDRRHLFGLHANLDAIAGQYSTLRILEGSLGVSFQQAIRMAVRIDRLSLEIVITINNVDLVPVPFNYSGQRAFFY